MQGDVVRKTQEVLDANRSAPRRARWVPFVREREQKRARFLHTPALPVGQRHLQLRHGSELRGPSRKGSIQLDRLLEGIPAQRILREPPPEALLEPEGRLLLQSLEQPHPLVLPVLLLTGDLRQMPEGENAQEVLALQHALEGTNGPLPVPPPLPQPRSQILIMPTGEERRILALDLAKKAFGTGEVFPFQSTEESFMPDAHPLGCGRARRRCHPRRRCEEHQNDEPDEHPRDRMHTPSALPEYGLLRQVPPPFPREIIRAHQHARTTSPREARLEKTAETVFNISTDRRVIIPSPDADGHTGGNTSSIR
ncbi:hypothetical protein HRbin10_02587 [bacterium HR10]|nr:hypothetical protein HRbin10_02587 [bacterium HR10]